MSSFFLPHIYKLRMKYAKLFEKVLGIIPSQGFNAVHNKMARQSNVFQGSNSNKDMTKK